MYVCFVIPDGVNSGYKLKWKTDGGYDSLGEIQSESRFNVQVAR